MLSGICTYVKATAEKSGGRSDRVVVAAGMTELDPLSVDEGLLLDVSPGPGLPADELAGPADVGTVDAGPVLDANPGAGLSAFELVEPDDVVFVCAVPVVSTDSGCAETGSCSEEIVLLPAAEAGRSSDVDELSEMAGEPVPPETVAVVELNELGSESEAVELSTADKGRMPLELELELSELAKELKLIPPKTDEVLVFTPIDSVPGEAVALSADGIGGTPVELPLELSLELSELTDDTVAEKPLEVGRTVGAELAAVTDAFVCRSDAITVSVRVALPALFVKVTDVTSLNGTVVKAL